MEILPGKAVPLLETDLVRTFLAIAESGSFTRAAAMVLRTPSAVSMQIRRLEDMLGCALFVRDGRTVRLTTEGEALTGYARRLLKLNEEAVRHFRAPAIEGVVRFGSPGDFGTRFLPAILARFARSHPAVDVDVVIDGSPQLVDRLADDGLDLTLLTARAEGPLPKGSEIVLTEPLVWAGLAGGIAYDRTPLPLALSTKGCPWRSAALASLDDAGRDYRIAYSSYHNAGLEAALLADLAIAPFPASVVAPPLGVFGQKHGLPDIGQYHILLKTSPQAGPAADALAAHVTATFRELNGVPAAIG